MMPNEALHDLPYTHRDKHILFVGDDKEDHFPNFVSERGLGGFCEWCDSV